MNDARRLSLAIVPALALTLSPLSAQQPLSPPLKNWSAPLYWAPQPGELEHQRALRQDASFSAQTASIFAAPGPMTFIALTPCRVMDTRSSQPFTGAFGPPSLAAYVTRQVPMLSSSCGIPSNAGAYSLNVTVVPPGALSFLTVWPAGPLFPGVSTLNDPVAGGVIANAAIVVAGTGGAIQMVAGNITDVIIDINGYYAAPSDGNQNTAIGLGTLANNTTGGGNMSSGFDALQDNTTGNFNTASGAFAMQLNTTGSYNTGVGGFALSKNTAGSNNTAVGASALQDNIGDNNTATGAYALLNNVFGIRNTASGSQALQNNTSGGGNTANGSGALQNNTVGTSNTAVGSSALGVNINGNNNIAIGNSAALSVSAGNSNNIDIGSPGVAGDGTAANSGVIRIGTSGEQTSFFVAGVSGITTGLASPVPVLIDANGQMGVMTSSQRFKEDIQDMGDSSSDLMRLRPVTFRYKQPYADGSKPIDYGLIAEEVADVYPDLVAHSSSGEIQTVQYQKVNAMLLNEVQKQHQQIQEQNQRSQTQQDEISGLKARLSEMEKLLETLAAPK